MGIIIICDFCGKNLWEEVMYKGMSAINKASAGENEDVVKEGKDHLTDLGEALIETLQGRFDYLEIIACPECGVVIHGLEHKFSRNYGRLGFVHGFERTQIDDWEKNGGKRLVHSKDPVNISADRVGDSLKLDPDGGDKLIDDIRDLMHEKGFDEHFMLMNNNKAEKMWAAYSEDFDSIAYMFWKFLNDPEIGEIIERVVKRCQDS